MSMWQWIHRLLNEPKWTAVFIFCLIGLLYLPSFNNVFIWDDEQFIVSNQFTTSLEYLPQIFTSNTIAGAGEVSNYYRPLTTLSFTVDRLIWGLEPFGFHLTNTVLHATSAILLWWLLRRLGITKGPALVIALLFGIHPIQTEAVVYIASRGDSFFVFWLLLSYIAFTFGLSRSPTKLPRLVWGMVVVGTFVLSVLAKEIALAGLGIYPALAIICTQQKNWRQNAIFTVVTVLAMGALAGLYLWLRLTVLNFGDSLNFHMQDSVYTENLWIRLLTFAKVLFTYLRLLVIPYPLHMERVMDPVMSWLSVWWPAAVLVVVATVIAGYVEWRRRHSFWIWFGGWWFACFLVPVSGVVPINGLLYEHWLYMPMVGFYIALWGVLRLLLPQIQQPRFFKAIAVIVGSVLVAFGVLTIRQNWLWRHPIPFYLYTLQYSRSARMLNNLANAYSNEGDLNLAMKYYQEAIAESDMYFQTHYNIASLLAQQGNMESAKKEIEIALGMNPYFDPAKLLWLDIAYRERDYERALALITDLWPRYAQSLPELWLIRGEALYKTGQQAEAQEVWDEVLRLSNSNPSVIRFIEQARRPT